MPRQIDYYFSLQSPWGLYRAQIVPGSRKYVRSQSESQAGGGWVDLFSETGGPAVDETPSGAAALSDARGCSAGATRARPEISSSAGVFAVQRPPWPMGVVIAAIKAGHDPDPFSAAGFLRRWCGRISSIWPIPPTLVKLADGSGLPGKQLVEAFRKSDEISAGLRAEPPGCSGGPMCSDHPVYVLRRRGILGDRIGFELLADALKSGRARRIVRRRRIKPDASSAFEAEQSP